MRSSPKAAASASARAARAAGRGGASRSRPRRSRPNMVDDGAGRRLDRGRHRAGHRARPSRRSAASTSSSTTSAAPPAPDLLDTTDAEWQAAFDETLFPAIRASRLAVPHMKQRGGGAIIMIASICGREAGGRMTYNAVKAAEISLAKSLAQQLAPINIRVNSVAPGSILFPGGSWHKRQQADPAGHRRVRQARAAVRPLRPPRGSRRRRRVPRLAARELGQRRVDRRRRLPGRGRTSNRVANFESESGSTESRARRSSSR